MEREQLVNVLVTVELHQGICVNLFQARLQFVQWDGHSTDHMQSMNRYHVEQGQLVIALVQQDQHRLVLLLNQLVLTLRGPSLVGIGNHLLGPKHLHLEIVGLVPLNGELLVTVVLMQLNAIELAVSLIV